VEGSGLRLREATDRYQCTLAASWAWAVGPKCTPFPKILRISREWNHNGITTNELSIAPGCRLKSQSLCFRWPAAHHFGRCLRHSFDLFLGQAEPFRYEIEAAEMSLQERPQHPEVNDILLGVTRR
jgi:hypothetical protein